jgi:CDP-glycerol glycerophosphotransferase
MMAVTMDNGLAKLRSIMFTFVRFLVGLLIIFIPRRRDLWVFGGWYGRRFTDNSKYLFLYVANEMPPIKAIWITRDERLLRKLRAAGYKAYMANSLRGLLYCLRAKYHIVDQDPDIDINSMTSPGAVCVQLWHGIPIKNIESYWAKDIGRPVHRFRSALSKFFCWTDPYVIATSKFTADLIRKGFGLKDRNMLITGYPRNDPFFSNDFEKRFKDKDIQKEIDRIRRWKRDGHLIAFFLPTFRENTKELFLGTADIDEITEFDGFLAKNRIKVLTKGHPAAQIKIGPRPFRNIMDLHHQLDLFPILKHVDLLITDYSSVCYDFMLLDRPMIFYPYDYDDYANRDRGFILDYDRYTPGVKVFDLEALKGAIIDVKRGGDRYKDDRKRVTKVMYKVVDGRASKRTVARLLEL